MYDHSVGLSDLDRARRFKMRLGGDEPLLLAQATFTDPAAAEILANAGFDAVVVDSEHSEHNFVTGTDLLRAMAGSAAVPFVRPPRADADEIRRWLDNGAVGILCPLVHDVSDAQALADARAYPPRGRRTFGPRRASGYWADTQAYFAEANEAIVVIAIIESRRGAENIDEILSTDGIDGVLIGSADLSLDLGVFGDYEHPIYRQAANSIVDAVRARGKALGIGCQSVEHARACRDEGYDLLLLASDDLLLAKGARDVVQGVRPQATC